MNRASAFALNLAERTNPIVIKELRQAVQSRLVGAILMLFLLTNLVVVTAFLVFSPDAATNPMAGQSIFFVLFGVLVFTCMVFVPLYAGIRLTMERNDSNIDLLFITTISTGKIVRGKFMAAMALTALIYSACMPFLALTYLMRGIDLPSIFLALAMGFLSTAGVIMLAIFAGSIQAGWFLRLVLGAAMLFVIFSACVQTIFYSFSITGFGISSIFRTHEDFYALAMRVLVGLAQWGVFYFLAVAALSAKSTNRMLPFRLYVTSVWAGFGIALAVWGWIVASLDSLLGWSMYSVGLFSVVLVFVFAERESWTPRVRRKIPRSLLGRFFAWLVYTGSAGGVAWCLSIIAASLVVGWICLGLPKVSDFVDVGGMYSYSGSSIGSGMLRTYRFVFGLFLFAVCYSMTGLLVRRLLVPRTSPLVGPTIGIGLLVLGCIMPFVAAYIVQGDNWRLEALPLVIKVFSPMVLEPAYSTDWAPAYLVLIGWAVLACAANISWFRAQWQAFRRYERQPVVEVIAEVVPEASGV